MRLSIAHGPLYYGIELSWWGYVGIRGPDGRRLHGQRCIFLGWMAPKYRHLKKNGW